MSKHLTMAEISDLYQKKGQEAFLEWWNGLSETERQQYLDGFVEITSAAVRAIQEFQQKILEVQRQLVLAIQSVAPLLEEASRQIILGVKQLELPEVEIKPGEEE